MKLLTIAAAFALVFALVIKGEEFAAPAPPWALDERAPAAEPAPVPGFDFEKRACRPSKCRCNGISGLFCGNSAINPNCPSSNVFQCNPSGTTCDFGVRDSCEKCGKLSC